VRRRSAAGGAGAAGTKSAGCAIGIDAGSGDNATRDRVFLSECFSESAAAAGEEALARSFAGAAVVRTLSLPVVPSMNRPGAVVGSAGKLTDLTAGLDAE